MVCGKRERYMAPPYCGFTPVKSPNGSLDNQYGGQSIRFAFQKEEPDKLMHMNRLVAANILSGDAIAKLTDFRNRSLRTWLKWYFFILFHTFQ